jgi:hypothetical protein
MKLSCFAKVTAASLVAGVALGFAAVPADAHTIPSRTMTVDTESSLVQAQYRSGRSWRGGHRFRGTRSVRSPRFRGHRSARIHRPFHHRHVRRHGTHISFGFALTPSILAAPYYYAPRYYEPYFHAAPVPYTAGLVPGSAAWIDYCSRKYRSFNRLTGLYLSYSGVLRPCQVP